MNLSNDNTPGRIGSLLMLALLCIASFAGAVCASSPRSAGPCGIAGSTSLAPPDTTEKSILSRAKKYPQVSTFPEPQSQIMLFHSP
jgi:hypothetical protein